MMIYMRNEKHPFKWLLAFIIFLLVLSVTFDDVYGLYIPPCTENGNSNLNGNAPNLSSSNVGYCYYPADYTNPTEPPNPPEIPEPATLILMAAGLGAIRLMRRK